jgi:hypothetical protein
MVCSATAAVCVAHVRATVAIFSRSTRRTDFRRAAQVAQDDDDLITLYRPTGPKELELVRDSGSTVWPPRLPHQPIFYPVLNEEYAIQIARDWNAKDPSTGYRGYVTRFRVRSEFLAKYSVKTVGSRIHAEYWIPSEDLDEFNQNIVGLIEVVHEFRGDR